ARPRRASPPAAAGGSASPLGAPRLDRQGQRGPAGSATAVAYASERRESPLRDAGGLRAAVVRDLRRVARARPELSTVPGEPPPANLRLRRRPDPADVQAADARAEAGRETSLV